MLQRKRGTSRISSEFAFFLKIKTFTFIQMFICFRAELGECGDITFMSAVNMKV